MTTVVLVQAQSGTIHGLTHCEQTSLSRLKHCEGEWNPGIYVHLIKWMQKNGTQRWRFGQILIIHWKAILIFLQLTYRPASEPSTYGTTTWQLLHLLTYCLKIYFKSLFCKTCEAQNCTIYSKLKKVSEIIIIFKGTLSNHSAPFHIRIENH